MGWNQDPGSGDMCNHSPPQPRQDPPNTAPPPWAEIQGKMRGRAATQGSKEEERKEKIKQVKRGRKESMVHIERHGTVKNPGGEKVWHMRGSRACETIREEDMKNRKKKRSRVLGLARRRLTF